MNAFTSLTLGILAVAHPVRAAHAPRPRPAAPAAASAASRRLDDVRIEGELPVPQVLFITARDQRRFFDFRTRDYVRTSRQVCESAVEPPKAPATPAAPNAARKENSR